VSDINRDERPEPLVERTREAFIKALSDRLKTTAYLAGRPELLGARSNGPFSCSVFRGPATTLLSNLLAADPAHRSALDLRKSTIDSAGHDGQRCTRIPGLSAGCRPSARCWPPPPPEMGKYYAKTPRSIPMSASSYRRTTSRP